jgi:23S rRNA (adenine2503-C2)-methyltransferase
MEYSQCVDAMVPHGWPAFRAGQVFDWVYRKLVADPERMSNLPKAHRQQLAEAFSFATTQILGRQSSSDGTQKLLLGWPDEARAETVMIPDGSRRTACVSSQVGCPVGCKFCASGIGGLRSNLSAGRIVEQIFTLNVLLAPLGERITNVVFMGMGEPLANYEQVVRACRILHEPRGAGLSYRRVTISTVGVPARMRQLADEDLPINLAISLHAPTEALRRELIPWAEHFPLSEILDAARYYFDHTGRELTLEYVLLAGVNDRPEHARKLAAICKPLRANVNLIWYNEVEGLPFARPSADAVRAFHQSLLAAGVNAHVRKSRGRDIAAACGQLRRREQIA